MVCQTWVRETMFTWQWFMSVAIYMVLMRGLVLSLWQFIPTMGWSLRSCHVCDIVWQVWVSDTCVCVCLCACTCTLQCEFPLHHYHHLSPVCLPCWVFLASLPSPVTSMSCVLSISCFTAIICHQCVLHIEFPLLHGHYLSAVCPVYRVSLAPLPLFVSSVSCVLSFHCFAAIILVFLSVFSFFHCHQLCPVCPVYWVSIASLPSFVTSVSCVLSFHCFTAIICH